MPILGSVKEDSPLFGILGRQVPLVHPLAIRPRDEAAPLCYLVAGHQLEPEQVEALAQHLHEIWQSELTLEEARAYITDPTGTPIKCEHFCGRSFTGKEAMLLL
ncbi:hypothetical protein [Pseudanabaena sp. FACHB-2040]|uniref:hypothetical protein n=1 Tax=Pseudanabaena sp. FACHB-2040 TaxID=2692859 RepID=UPI0016843551|nr:hypothetical protein [Pseudanabaena sp. FACHB-2040]MBD2259899.1 hypothetical protein [Pseudanabaena sp. FACHB-2040]